MREIARDTSFCAHAINQAGIIIVPDLLEDDRFKDNPLVTGDPFIRFYAGVPILSEGGLRMGTLCVIDYKPRSLVNPQIFSLEVLARRVRLLLKHREKINPGKVTGDDPAAFENHFRRCIRKNWR